MRQLTRISFPAILLLAACAPPAADESGTLAHDAVGLARAEPSYVFKGDAGRYSASNPTLGIDARLDEGGARISAGGAALKLNFTGFGRRETLQNVPPVSPVAGVVPGTDRTRVEYAHDGITVWWDNTSAGIQQGFSIERAPAGKGELALRIGVYGAMAESRGDAVVFRDQSGGTWQYAGLGAEDAKGKALPARMELVGGSVVLLVDDTDATYPIAVDPFTTYTVGTVTGEATGDQLGYSVGSGQGGDINGDGFPDVVVGAPQYNGGDGRVYVYYGNELGLPDSVGLVLDAPRSGAEFGTSVSILGDVNDDGYADVAVGGPQASVSATGDGAVWIYHGSESGVSDVPDTEITGSATANAYFGYAVEGGDINGDGRTDLIVGEYGYSTERGRAWIFAGSAGGISTTTKQTLTGPSAGARYGFSVTIGGSTNGDAFAEFVVGMPYHTTTTLTGRALYYVGSASTFSSTPTATTTYNSSGTAGYRYGWAVTLDGDFNGDGYGDLVVGAPTGASTGFGRVYHYNGTSAGLPGGANGTISGTSAMYFGASLAAIGDLNADGYGDLLVGAPTYATSQGYAALFVGKSGGTGLVTTVNQQITGLSGDYLGTAVAGVGDINRDGYADFIVGSPGAGGVGEAKVHYGGVDEDNDGYLDNGNGSLEDCDDDNDEVSPGQTELCDAQNVDENCDGQSEEAGASGESTWYADLDGDGYGDGGDTVFSCDPPVGYVADNSDCDDDDKNVNPAAQEVCDEFDIDEDCNGLSEDDDSGATGQMTFYADDDSDGFGNSGEAVDFACDSRLGVATDGDCDALNADINPGTQEVCDEFDVDEDCDGTVDDGDESAMGQSSWYADLDADGYGDFSNPVGAACDMLDATMDTSDCDDRNADVNPGMAEVCDVNDVDENCDGASEESGATGEVRWYFDTDADGYGQVGGLMTIACDARGASTEQTDCDDDNAGINPGATEVCDAADVDEDCDGQGDESGATGETLWYADGDADGFGNPTATAMSCDVPSGYVADKTDCDDDLAAINPAAAEVCDAANVDENCNGRADNADSGATGTTRFYTDGDGDGFGIADANSVLACDLDSGYSVNTDDCDDEKSLINPDATEICDADNTDEDCDGTADEAGAAGETRWYEDDDSDGFGNADVFVGACEMPMGYTADNTDCNDEKSAINPGATEVCDAANVDENCSGAGDEGGAVGETLWFADLDTDGYGDSNNAVLSCDLPGGYVADKTDCNDTKSTINPAAVEVCDVSNTDENCSGTADEAGATGEFTWYRDSDNDGYGLPAPSTVACDQPSGFALFSTDCNDAVAAINPGAAEVCDVLDTDEDCDGTGDEAGASGSSLWYADADGDLYGDVSMFTNSCDAPSGYIADKADCDDRSASVNPGQTEVCDPANVDEDCDGSSEEAGATGEVTWYRDGDTDGYGNASVTLQACDLPAGYLADATDCNDASSAINPDATEVCDAANTDENCNGVADDSSAEGRTEWYPDADNDTYGTNRRFTLACDAPAGSIATRGDCDDLNANVNPGEIEVCDPLDVDENCDGAADDASAAGMTAWYLDSDDDGYGNPSSTVMACDAPAGAESTGTDCNDASAAVNPGAVEICDMADIDENCDGKADDASAIGQVNWYDDRDVDGYGDPTAATSACNAPVGFVADNTDCVADDPMYHPGADESDCSDSNDYNCDGSVAYADLDGDGYAACEECNDADVAVNPSVIDETADGIDSDCDGEELCFVDADSDFYTDGSGTTVVSLDPSCADAGEADATVASGDCADTDADRNPGELEECDGIDENCDSVIDDGYTFVTYYDDLDGDGYGVDGSAHDECATPASSATMAGDCDDTSADVSPADLEVCDGNGVDEDCDGDKNEAGAVGEITFYADIDGDGYGDAAMPLSDCEAPTGYVPNDSDCDDLSDSVYPGATEVAGDSIDQDCDGQEWCFVDADDDEYLADSEALVLSPDADCDDAGEAPVGANAGDCDDANAAYNPGALEDDCTDPNDYNCDGAVGYADGDGDGYAACEECNDADAAINASAIETVGDGVDFDCDGTEECLVDGDGDRYTTGDGAVVTSEDADCADLGEAAADAAEGDCNDGDASISPEGTDIPDDFIDQDCDGTDATSGGGEDTGTEDTGSEDTGGETGEIDTGSADTAGDTGTVDTGWDDTGGEETGTVDTGTVDTGPEDTAETGEVDTGSEDTGAIDTGSEDTGTLDTGSEDTAETGVVDTGSEDTGPDDSGVEETGDTSVVDDTADETDEDPLPVDEDTGEGKDVPAPDCGCDGDSSGLVGLGVMLLAAGGLARRKK